MPRLFLAALAALSFTLTAAAEPGGAQIRASEPGSVSQTVDGTTLTVEYSRPVARGRVPFGEVVPWGLTWTPGANWATTLEVDRDVRVNGVEVPVGRYSVWMVPRDRTDGPWSVFLDPTHRLFHFQKPDSTAEQIHLTAEPREAPHAEVLTWSFPAVQGDVTVLQMAWGTTAVPLTVTVEPTEPPVVAEGDAPTYVGTYALEMASWTGWPEDGRFRVTVRDGRLRGRFPFPYHEGDELEFDLLPVGPHRFLAGLYRDGKIFNVERAGVFEFAVDEHGEPAGKVVFRGIEGSVFGEGPRVGG